MAKPIGTDGGRRNWVILQEMREVIAALEMDLDIQQHPTLGDVVACNSYAQAEEIANQLRYAPAPSIG